MGSEFHPVQESLQVITHSLSLNQSPSAALSEPAELLMDKKKNSLAVCLCFSTLWPTLWETVFKRSPGWHFQCFFTHAPLAPLFQGPWWGRVSWHRRLRQTDAHCVVDRKQRQAGSGRHVINPSGTFSNSAVLHNDTIGFGTYQGVNPLIRSEYWWLRHPSLMGSTSWRQSLQHFGKCLRIS